jgi:anaerobic magnesium-protoporphyrin IX monomethyl ester cyclase
MLDLSLLRDSESFAIEGSPRIAMVHHGFRPKRSKQVQEVGAALSSRYPSLGLLALARSLEVNWNEGRLRYEPEVRYFQEENYPDDCSLVADVVSWLEGARWRFLLLGVYTVAADHAESFARQFDPRKVCIITGGPHVTVAPAADYMHIAVRGEGDRALRHILNELSETNFGLGPDSLGVCFVLDGKVHSSSPAFNETLATLPAPAYRYDIAGPNQGPRGPWWKAVGSNPQIYVCTQSCSARCTFCSTYMIHGRALSRKIHEVRLDIEYIVRTLGHDSIEFHDDDLTQHEDFDSLLEILAERKLRWTCNVRAESIDSERAALMWKSGCRRVFVGLESLDQTTLDYYRKGTTVETNERAVRNLDESGIGVASGLIIGAPHQTVESILADFNRFLRLPILYLSPSILTPDFGTVEFYRARRRIKALNDLTLSPSGPGLRPRPDLFGDGEPYGLPTVCANVEKDALNELYDYMCCAFFLRDETFYKLSNTIHDSRRSELTGWYTCMRSRSEQLGVNAKIGAVRELATTLNQGVG